MGDYWQTLGNLRSDGRSVNGVHISNELLKSTLLKASEMGLLDDLAPRCGIPVPSLCVPILESRLSKGVDLNSNGKDFETLIAILLENDDLRKSLSSDGEALPDLPGPDFGGIETAVRKANDKKKAEQLRKSREKMVATSRARANILTTCLELRRAGMIEGTDVVKTENRLNKGMELQPHVREALIKAGCGNDVRFMERSTAAFLMKAKTDREIRAMSDKQRSEYFFGQDLTNKRKGNTLMKGEDTTISVENKFGQTREVPVRKIREQLNALVLSKSQDVALPISTVELLLNKAAQGSSAAKETLEKKYSYFLQGLFS